MALLPHISEAVGQARIEKVHETWEHKRDGGCSAKVRSNLETAGPRTRSHAIAGEPMRASHRYVGYVKHASRVHREAPALFEEARAGRITIQDARRRISGETDEARPAVF